LPPHPGSTWQKAGAIGQNLPLNPPRQILKWLLGAGIFGDNAMGWNWKSESWSWLLLLLFPVFVALAAPVVLVVVEQPLWAALAPLVILGFLAYRIIQRFRI
jgi:hypothetical protein